MGAAFSFADLFTSAIMRDIAYHSTSTFLLGRCLKLYLANLLFKLPTFLVLHNLERIVASVSVLIYR